jgi:hypothetical protein
MCLTIEFRFFVENCKNKIIKINFVYFLYVSLCVYFWLCLCLCLVLGWG